MPADHTLIERYEYKYRIPPSLVGALRQHVSRYCEADPASASGPYLISSLYLDSPRRLFYRHSKQRRAQRLKLRVRRYASGPLYLEEKRRHGALALKTRVAIDAADWPDVLFESAGGPHVD